ncbi:MAG: TlyA family RNA methyltransferase [Proteobacteria bacterium]|nr:TlyA family RNA methyltransferase [Pseudomonadota bacterium]
MAKKDRIDKLIFERGFAPSRERAQAYIMAGKVLVGTQKIDKPGQKFPVNCEIRILGEDQPYVSRGGLKLAKAIQQFNIEVKNRVAMDIGASTGGFTDCLLQNQASFVFAVDSGTNQLDWKLISNSRVKNMEKCNFRHLTMADIGTHVDLAVIDVSFISLTKILGNCYRFLVKGGQVIALIKPQFEAGRDQVKKGGLVNDTEIHHEVVETIKRHAESIGFACKALDKSPIQGKKSGNREFLIHLEKPHSR